MVNHLDATFSALSDPTRRAILAMLINKNPLTITELAKPFAMSLPGFSKHVQVLERARLVTRTKTGRDNFLYLNPAPLQEVRDWLAFHEDYWNQRFSALDAALEQHMQQKTRTRKPGTRKRQ